MDIGNTRSARCNIIGVDETEEPVSRWMVQ